MCFKYQLKPCLECSNPKEVVLPCDHSADVGELCKPLTPGTDYDEVEECSKLCYWCYNNKRAALPKLYKHWNVGVLAAGITSVGAYVIGTGDNTLAFILTSSAIAMHGVNLALIRSKISKVNRIAPEEQEEFKKLIKLY